jgi:hypothetical protein
MLLLLLLLLLFIRRVPDHEQLLRALPQRSGLRRVRQPRQPW